MKRIAAGPWRQQCLRTTRPSSARHHLQPHNHCRHSVAPTLRLVSTQSRSISTSSTHFQELSTPPSSDPVDLPPIPPSSETSSLPKTFTPSPKLAALHARLSLPSRLPLETLSQALIDDSVDPNPRVNNSALATLGADLLSYHTSEHLICNYPRLPMEILFASQWAFVGPKALATMTREWGVEAAAAPGKEVDTGILQFRRVTPGNEAEQLQNRRQQELEHGGYDIQKGWLQKDSFSGNVAQGNRDGGHVGSGRANEGQHYRRGVTSRIVYDDEFGDLRGVRAGQERDGGKTLEEASTTFVRALFGAIFLHCGRAMAKSFHQQHVLSRRLDLSSLFSFRFPTRDLSRLCAREGFEPPVARLLSETGRLSRHPVFVVGVYSGRDMLGEAAGASLQEAKVRASVVALKGWYLYRPLEVTVPSEAEDARSKWIPNVPDLGEIIT